jgi:hypothetical protein
MTEQAQRHTLLYPRAKKGDVHYSQGDAEDDGIHLVSQPCRECAIGDVDGS